VLGMSPSTLNSWRSLGLGPPFIRLGGDAGTVRYRCAELKAWLDERVRQSTRAPAKRHRIATPIPSPARRRVRLPDHAR
jgi:predicted DNA-binding transcriptional regulator AlpA